MSRRRKLKSAQITLPKTVQTDSRLAGGATGAAPSEQLRAAPVRIADPENPNKTIEFLRPMRDPLNWYHSIGTFDDPQWLAGETYRDCLKTAQFGLSAIDFRKTAVDGGKIYEPVSDHQLKASRRLTQCHIEWRNWGRRIKEDTIFIMDSFLLRMWFPGKIAGSLGRHGERETAKITGRIVDGLQMASFVFTNCS